MKRSSLIETVLILLLFTLFIGGIFLITLYAADAYRSVVNQTAERRETDLPLAYLNMKLKQTTGADSVYLTTYGDVQCLVLTEVIDQETYYTYIYLYDHALYELFTPSTAFDAASGDKLMDVYELTMSDNDDSYCFTATAEDGSQGSIQVVIR